MRAILTAVGNDRVGIIASVTQKSAISRLLFYSNFSVLISTSRPFQQ